VEPSGNFSASGFTNVATVPVNTPTMGYVNVGGATNYPSRYYRIVSP
jgi:hypothetical protein